MIRSLILYPIFVLLTLCLFAAPLAARNDPTTVNQQTLTGDLAEADKLSLEVLNLFKLGEFETALPLAKRVLKIREKLLPTNDVLLADSQSNLAELYLALHRMDDAESLFKRSVKIYEIDAARNGSSLANVLDRLGLFREFAREPAKAEELYRRGLAIRQKVLGANHTETKDAIDRLAAFYVRRKEYAKALPILHQQVADAEKKHGAGDQQVGKLLERLACVLYKNNDTVEATTLEARANSILYADAAKKNEPLILSQESFDCRLIGNPRPQFPRSAIGRFTGAAKIIVAVEVNEKGEVVNAQMVVGDPLFKKESEKAALTAKLRPLSVDGKPLKIKGTITHGFSVMTTTRIVAVPGVVGRP